MGDATIRVLLVDDHQVVRRGLRTFLEVQPDIEVVGEARDGAEGVDLAEACVQTSC
jgi:DNA-binding NarL/FixJ family response regulator